MEVQKVPVRWIETQFLNSTKSAFVKVFTGPETPALFTIMSTLPNSSWILLNIVFMPISSDTSTSEKDFTLPDEPEVLIMSFNTLAVYSRGSFLLPNMIIFAPFSANF